MSPEPTCGFSWREMLWLLLASLATAYPATRSLPDARPTSQAVGRVPLEHFCEAPQLQNLSFADGSRAAPLTRGPCVEGYWVVHDLAAEEGPRLRCALRPCPNDQVPLDGRCVSHADASAAQCSGGALQLDSTGLLCCGSFSETPALIPAGKFPSAVDVGQLNCAQGDGGKCGKKVQDPPTSESDFQPEN